MGNQIDFSKANQNTRKAADGFVNIQSIVLEGGELKNLRCEGASTLFNTKQNGLHKHLIELAKKSDTGYIEITLKAQVRAADVGEVTTAAFEGMKFA